MITHVAIAVSVALGLWLIAIGLVMLIAPGRAIAALAAMGSSRRIHFGELGLRTLAGIALIAAAPTSQYPAAITGIGAFLTISAVVLMILPRRWHAAYSGYWARRFPALAVRLLSPVSMIAGGALILTLMQALPSQAG